MVIFEDFIVEAPISSGFSVGDTVQINMNVTLQQGFCLRNGIVVKIDTDPDQDLLPLFFVVGMQTHIRSPLTLGSLQKSGKSLRAKL